MTDPTNLPRVSVIVPIRNEADFIERCLRSILANDYPRDRMEVLVVDGMSEDGTRDIVRRLAAGDVRLRLLDNPERIVPHAMNRGITEATGDVVMRLDSHAEYAPDYVDQCLAVLQRTGADVVGGCMETRPGSDTPAGRAIAAASSSPFGVGNAPFRTGGREQEADAIPFGCFRRDAFDRFGRYDERLVRNQDIELYSRIRRGGGRVIVSPDIRLVYYNRSSFAGLRQQAFHNGLWNPYTVYLTGGGLRARHFVPLGFVLSAAALAVAGSFWWPFWIALAAELALYLAAATLMARRAARPAGLGDPGGGGVRPTPRGLRPRIALGRSDSAAEVRPTARQGPRRRDQGPPRVVRADGRVLPHAGPTRGADLGGGTRGMLPASGSRSNCLCPRAAYARRCWPRFCPASPAPGRTPRALLAE